MEANKSKLENALSFLDEQFSSARNKLKKKKKLKKSIKKESANKEETTIKGTNKEEKQDDVEMEDLFKQVEVEVAEQVDPYKKLNIKKGTKEIDSSDVIKGIMDPAIHHIYDQNCKNSMFLIENYVGSINQKDKNAAIVMNKRRSFKGVIKPSKSQFKRSKIFDIRQGDISFDEMVQVHLMWKDYMRDVLGIQKSKNNEPLKSIITEASKMSVLQKIAKADFHGALISIFEAKNNKLIGLEGIIVKESRQTMTIICDNNKLKVVPKMNTTFLIKIPDGTKVKLYGDAL
jgi:RNase P/RNase MRP subunit p29